MKLIEYDGIEFKIADEALLVRPIRELFLKDKSKKKEEFWKQLSFLWFMCDPRSTYQYLTDESERAAEIKKQEGFEEDWEPSALLREAMVAYRSQATTTASLLLESMRKAIDNLRSFFETAKLTDTDDKGKPIYQISSFTAALKQIPELAKALSDAEKALAKDFATEDSARGNATKAVGEDL